MILGPLDKVRTNQKITRKAHLVDAYVLLSWTALYFIIHYYLLLEAETRKALEAAASAQKAQISMLRYQLNPHFLFNTLNAISTLVMDNDSKTANGMLNRLSSFLRYTLVNQSTQKMTVAKEIEAIKLYLDIEKIRFEDRLTIVWNVDDEVQTALIPSLILQPLIENSIKYAIAPSENGGTIEIVASKEQVGKNERLVLKVIDDGPGLPSEQLVIPETSAGVGLGNTQERLQQLYGDEASFKLESSKPNGLVVYIEMPFEV